MKLSAGARREDLTEKSDMRTKKRSNKREENLPDRDMVQ